MKGQSVSRERERKDTPFEEKISTTRPTHEKRRRRREETKFFDEERLIGFPDNTIFSTVALSSMTRNEGKIAQVLDSHLKFRKFTVLVVLLVVVSFCS